MGITLIPMEGHINSKMVPGMGTADIQVPKMLPLVCKIKGFKSFGLRMGSTIGPHSPGDVSDGFTFEKANQ
jgi:hypothetical protein